MPKVAADNSPLLERAIFGYDGTNYRVVKVDTDGNLVAAIKATQTIEVTQDIAADLLATVNIAAGQTIEVTQDTAADLLATVNIAAGQTIEVTQDTAADLLATVDLAADQNVQARGHGWIGAAWQKNPLLLGYSGIISELKSDLNAAAPNATLTSTAVPAGEIWVVTAISAVNNNTVVTRINLYVNVGGVTTSVTITESPAAGVGTFITCYQVLAEGNTVNAAFNGTNAGDDIHMRYVGFRVDIDQ